MWRVRNVDCSPIHKSTMKVLILLILLGVHLANSQDYETRKQNLIDNALAVGANPTGIAPIQAA
jgi:hypothetical protein